MAIIKSQKLIHIIANIGLQISNCLMFHNTVNNLFIIKTSLDFIVSFILGLMLLFAVSPTLACQGRIYPFILTLDKHILRGLG